MLFCCVVCDMLLGAMPEDSAAPGGGGLVSKTRATDFSIAAIMARGVAAPTRKQQQNCRTELHSPLTPAADGK